jgi:hypothetical protein
MMKIKKQIPNNQLIIHMKPHKILTLVCVVGLSLMPGSARAVVYSWTGVTSGDWTNASNWDANGIPVDSLAGGNLELASLTDDRIEFNALGSSNPIPTSGIPTLGGAAGGTRAHVTPQFDLLHGSILFSAYGHSNEGLVANTSQSWTNTVGDGNTANGSASLTYLGGFTQGIFRDDQGQMIWNVNADGTLVFDSGSATTLIIQRNASRTPVFNLNGGAMVSLDAIDLYNDSFSGAGNSFIDFQAEGSRFTADFGADFLDLASVQAAIDNSVFFTSTTSQSMGVTDNSDGTFTVLAVPEPSTTALLGLGGLALILRRHK